MKERRYTAEEIVAVPAASRSGDRQRQDHTAGMSRERDHQQTYYRWRKEYGGLIVLAHMILRLLSGRQLLILSKRSPESPRTA